MTLKYKFLIWFRDRVYHRYDVRVVDTVTVYTYWKLKTVKPGPGFICIPLRLRRESEYDQVSICREGFRKALALRILSKTK